MEKKYLVCRACGYAQSVRADEIWGCSNCKKKQMVAGSEVRMETGLGRRMCVCPACGYVQSVRGDIWMCYKCRKDHLTAKTMASMEAGGAA